MDKARKCIEKALADLSAGFHDEAGRHAYLAGFHAAQALILLRGGRAAKTHRGVHTQFFKLTEGDARFDRLLQKFLSTTYALKAVADYEVGPSATVPKEYAAKAIETATRFVDCIETILKEEDKQP